MLEVGVGLDASSPKAEDECGKDGRRPVLSAAKTSVGRSREETGSERMRGRKVGGREGGKTGRRRGMWRRTGSKGGGGRSGFELEGSGFGRRGGGKRGRYVCRVRKGRFDERRGGKSSI